MNGVEPNMVAISVTAPVFHLDTSELNELAILNMLYMVVTALTSHLDKSWLKTVAW